MPNKIKVCRKCGCILTDRNWNKFYSNICINCKKIQRKLWEEKNPNYGHEWNIKNRDRVKATHKVWRSNHPNYLNMKNRQYRKRDRLIILKHYSPDLVCQRCGFSDIRALSIDHINGGGGKHMRDNRIEGSGFYRWIIRNNFPKEFQVLCMNCQWIKKQENNESPTREWLHKLRNERNIKKKGESWYDYLKRIHKNKARGPCYYCGNSASCYGYDSKTFNRIGDSCPNSQY